MFAIKVSKVRLIQERVIYTDREPHYDGSLRNILPILRKELAGAAQEHYLVLSLDPNGVVIDITLAGLGTLTEVAWHQRNIFTIACAANAYGIIVAHSHPGSSAIPSPADKKIHDVLEKAAQVMGISLLDDVVVAGNNSYFSHAEHERRKSLKKFDQRIARTKVTLQRRIGQGKASRRDVLRLQRLRLNGIPDIMIRVEAITELREIVAALTPIVKTGLHIRRDVRQHATEYIDLAQRMISTYQEGGYFGLSDLDNVLLDELKAAPTNITLDYLLPLPKI